MSCFCCESIYNLGCVSVCEDSFLDTGLIADEGNAGIFTLHLNFDGVGIIISQNVEVGDPIVFPITSNCLNESYTYEGKIYDANGDIVVLEYNEIIYDCIKFQTIINIIC